MEHLKLKLSQPKQADINALLIDNPDRTDTVKFESTNSELVRKAATKSREDSYPSGVNANSWKHMLLSKHFGEPYSDFCQTFAKVAIKTIC